MPSHSKKQHNFMEAIAHSPSFAKKAGVPQSVGKDYAAADKGKTFSKGGEMKESKGMVGKEVAFFKKKGAPKSMIKHEESEMKGYARGGKVRRMAEGGDTDMSMGYGDPFAKPRDYAKEKAQGAENLEGIKNFFGFGKKKEEEKPVMGPPPSGGGRRPLPTVGASTSSVSSQSPRTRRNNEDTSDSDAVERSDAAMLAASRDKNTKGPQFAGSLNGGFEDNAPAQRESKVGSGASGFNQTPYQDSGFSALNKPSVAKRKPIGVEKTVKKERVITAPNDNSYASMEERRAKASESRMLDKKPSAMTRQMREAPTGEQLWSGQKSMGDEIGDALKSFRASIRGGLKAGEDKRRIREAETHIAKGGQVKKMAFGGDTGQPMRGGPRAPMPPAPAMNPNSIAALQAQYGMRPQGGPPMKAGGSVKKMAEGGFTREADGVAKKGKTQGKVVKMAGGGFVRSADGCAQRGKTKAFQVKMNRGGMC